jgi:hypothetical protein
MAEDSKNSKGFSKSSTVPARLSISAGTKEAFLERLVNLNVGGERKKAQFRERFRKLLPTRALDLREGSLTYSGNGEWFLWEVAQPKLRELWAKPSPLAKEIDLMVLAGNYMVRCGRESSERAIYPTSEPGSDGFVMALLHALKRSHLLRLCANPGCKDPYFVAKRASQIYCSGPCAEPAQREAKSRWWREHGEAIRKQRRKKLRKRGRKLHPSLKKGE